MIKKWVDNVRRIAPDADIFLIDNTLDEGKFAKKVGRAHSVKVEYHKWKPAKKMLDLEHWKQGYRHHLQMLAECREKYRKYFLKGDYTHLFNVDVDVFPKLGYLKKLISYDKDQVGPVIHVYPKPSEHKPATFHSSRMLFTPHKKRKIDLDYYKFNELNIYKRNARDWIMGRITNGWKPDDPRNPYLHKCYATSFGCLLIKRKVLEKVPFRTHPTYIHGEDLWYYKEAYDKGFESWVDCRYRVKHLNCSWNKVHNQCFQQLMALKLYRIGGNDGSIRGVPRRKFEEANKEQPTGIENQ